MTPDLTPLDCTERHTNARFAQATKKEKALQTIDLQGFSLVEVAGFEPTTFWSRTKRATKPRYTSKKEPIKGLEPLT